MVARFGGAGDLSALLGSLALQQERDLESRLRQAESQNDERQAAEDQDTFSMWESGEMSDEELLAYIDRRVDETRHDKRENAHWLDQQRELSTRIEDDQAEAAFENGGSIADLIRYYRLRRNEVDTNSPRYREITSRLNNLIDKRASDDTNRGANKISAQIEAGKATLNDLLRFYRGKASELRAGSPLKDSIEKAIADTQGAIRDQNRETSLARLNLQLTQGKLTPQQFAKEYRRIAESYRVSDPERYFRMLDESANLVQTAEASLERAKIDNLLTTGQITPQQAEQRYYALAEKVSSYDPSAYFQLRTTGYEIGQRGIPGATPLENPDALSGLGRMGVPQFTWVSQFDGTRYASVNCTMAAGAMLASAMGVVNLSGGDLRYLSGDREGGTNLAQLNAALGGVGLSANVRNNMDFEAYKKKVGSGQASVLQGIYGNLPPQLRGQSGFTGGHAIFVGAYDAKTDRFYVMDPIHKDKNYKGEWWDASVIQNYGWGPGLNGQQFYGSVAFQPRNTVGNIKTPVNARVRYVSVDTAPMRPNTPKSYVGLSNPGASGERRIAMQADHNVRQSRNGTAYEGIARGLEGLGIPTTAEQAAEFVSQVDARQVMAEGMLNAFNRGESEYNGIKLSIGLMRDLNEQVINQSDYEFYVLSAMGKETEANKVLNAKAEFMTNVKVENAERLRPMFNNLLTTIERKIGYAANDPDPEKAQEAIEWSLGLLERWRTLDDRGVVEFANPDAPDNQNPLLDVSKDFVSEIEKTYNTLSKLANQDTSELERSRILGGVAPTLAPLAQEISNQAVISKGLSTGELVLTVDSMGVVGPARVRPTRLMDPATGQAYYEDLPYALVTGQGDKPLQSNPNEMPRVLIDINGEPTQVFADFQEAGTGVGYYVVQNATGINLPWFKRGAKLTRQQLEQLGPEKIQQLLSSQQLAVEEWKVKQVTLPSGTIMQQDPGTGLWHLGELPIRGFDPTFGPGAAWDDEQDAPELDFAPFAHLSGMVMPYDGKNWQQAQIAMNLGELTTGATGRYRDETGALTTDVRYAPQQGSEFTQFDRGGSTATIQDRVIQAYDKNIRNAQSTIVLDALHTARGSARDPSGRPSAQAQWDLVHSAFTPPDERGLIEQVLDGAGAVSAALGIRGIDPQQAPGQRARDRMEMLGINLPETRPVSQSQFEKSLIGFDQMGISPTQARERLDTALTGFDQVGVDISALKPIQTPAATSKKAALPVIKTPAKTPARVPVAQLKDLVKKVEQRSTSTKKAAQYDVSRYAYSQPKAKPKPKKVGASASGVASGLQGAKSSLSDLFKGMPVPGGRSSSGSW